MPGPSLIPSAVANGLSGECLARPFCCWRIFQSPHATWMQCLAGRAGVLGILQRLTPYATGLRLFATHPLLSSTDASSPQPNHCALPGPAHPARSACQHDGGAGADGGHAAVGLPYAADHAPAEEDLGGCTPSRPCPRGPAPSTGPQNALLLHAACVPLVSFLAVIPTLFCRSCLSCVWLCSFLLHSVCRSAALLLSALLCLPVQASAGCTALQCSSFVAEVIDKQM